jgi:microcin C transport system substrate-binding protein
LREAGYVIRDAKRVSPQDELFVVEFLIDDPISLAHHNAFIKNLGILGVEANVRVVDPVQYRRRVDDFDFDIVVQRFGFSSTPGDSLRTFFTSRAAGLRGSQNVGGISDPVIDALVERVIAAESRPALLAACKALDRVIRSGRYWVPHWYKAFHWLAYWDVFGRPEAQPRYALAIRETWWAA